MNGIQSISMNNAYSYQINNKPQVRQSAPSFKGKTEMAEKVVNNKSIWAAVAAGFASFLAIFGVKPNGKDNYNDQDVIRNQFLIEQYEKSIADTKDYDLLSFERYCANRNTLLEQNRKMIGDKVSRILKSDKQYKSLSPDYIEKVTEGVLKKLRHDGENFKLDEELVHTQVNFVREMDTIKKQKTGAKKLETSV